jgi:hypothetical protein
MYFNNRITETVIFTELLIIMVNFIKRVNFVLCKMEKKHESSYQKMKKGKIRKEENSQVTKILFSLWKDRRGRREEQHQQGCKPKENSTIVYESMVTGTEPSMSQCDIHKKKDDYEIPKIENGHNQDTTSHEVVEDLISDPAL